MRIPAAALLVAVLAACGRNPAFNETDAASATATTAVTTTDPTTGPSATGGTTTGGTTTGTTTGGTTTGGTTTGGTTIPIDPTTGTTADATTTGTTTGTTTDTETTGFPLDPTCPDDQDLIACYVFPPGEVDVLLDGASGAHNGTMVDIKLEPSVAPDFDRAGQFDGTSEAIVDHDPDLNSTLTISLFAFFKNISEERAVLNKDGRFALLMDNGQLTCSMVNADLQTESVDLAMVPIEGWVHIGCVFDGAKIQVWIHSEGNMLTDNYLLVNPMLATDSTAPLVFGHYYPNRGMHFEGRLDHVLLYRRALTAPELCALSGPLCN